MHKLTVISREGIEKTIDSAGGGSVMELIRGNGFDELLAICGGCCSCATCHVYVDPAYADHLSPMGEDENDLLEGSGTRKENSRLACQLKLGGSVAELRVTIAPED